MCTTWMKRRAFSLRSAAHALYSQANTATSPKAARIKSDCARTDSIMEWDDSSLHPARQYSKHSLARIGAAQAGLHAAQGQ